MRLKELTLCNFDFLLAAVRTISVSYLRSILEHARCYVLDRDVELVYYTVRKSSDVLTRDTLQLGAQIISWLRPVAGKSSSYLVHFRFAAHLIVVARRFFFRQQQINAQDHKIFGIVVRRFHGSVTCTAHQLATTTLTSPHQM